VVVGLVTRGATTVEEMLADGTVEPTSEELLREARSIHPGNPRAALLLAVAAAEQGSRNSSSTSQSLEVDVEATIGVVRLLLRQFAYYRGVGWAAPAW
jgi:hypothetical protein